MQTGTGRFIWFERCLKFSELAGNRRIIAGLQRLGFPLHHTAQKNWVIGSSTTRLLR